MSRTHVPFLPQDHEHGHGGLPILNHHEGHSGPTDRKDSIQSNDHHAHDPDEEVTKIELFYDLFFVANLTVFTYIHDVSDNTSLLQYIWFFSVLWFSWYQVALYDVRYSKLDCMAARLSKVVQFSVMIIFASTGPLFKVGGHPEDEDRAGSYYKTNDYYGVFTLALMASRIVLAVQYYLIRRLYQKTHPETRRPLTTLVLTYAFAAVVYGAVYHFFTDPGNSNAYIAWYVIGPVESIVATFVACSKTSSGLKFLNKLPAVKRLLLRIVHGESDKLCFSNKLLVERMSLLTLIILGEGAISIAKQCQTVAYAWSLTWNAVNVINILSSVLIMYFIYLLYFDWIEHNPQIEEMGSVRQRFWAGTHFWLHLALVLAIQGVKLSILWSAATVKIHSLASHDQDWTALHERNEAVLTKDLARFNASAYWWYGELEEITGDQSYMVKTYSDALDTINDQWRVWNAVDFLNTTAHYNNASISNVIRAYRMMNYTAYTSIYTIAGFSKTKLETEEYEYFIPEFRIEDPFWGNKVDAGGEGETKYLKETRNHFRLTYKYLFASIGLVVLICALLAYLSQPEQASRAGTKRRWGRALVRGEWYHRLRLTVTTGVGVALCLLAIKSISDDDTFMRTVSTPWMLPSIMGALLLAVFVNSIKLDIPPLRLLARLFGKPRDTKPAQKYGDIDQLDTAYGTTPKDSSQQHLSTARASSEDTGDQTQAGATHDEGDHSALEMQRML